MIFKLENMQKRENTWNIKKHNFKTEKKRKQNKWGTKRNLKKGKTWEKMDLSICIFFAFILLSRFVLFCFYFTFDFACCLEKKQTKKQNKIKYTNWKSKTNATKSIVSSCVPLFDFPLFSPFFSFYFVSVFFGFCWFVFWFFLLFFAFVAHFFKN